MAKLSLLLSTTISSVLLVACGGSSDTTNSNNSDTNVDVVANCGDLAHGATQSRVRYQQASVAAPNSCQSEVQTRQCQDGQLSTWSGQFAHASCQVQNNDDPLQLPLWQISQLSYLGGFRLSAAKFGDSPRPSLSYSPGPIALNKKNESLFVVGHDYEQGIAEFAIPQIVNSRNHADFVVGSTVLQNFAPFHQTDRVNTGIEHYFRVTGMALINDSLLVNYMNWYDAGGKETDTSVHFAQAADLANSQITGPYQVAGAAHAAGWISEIPPQWQPLLGGTHITGHASGSIRSRLSVGPSAFVFSPLQTLLTAAPGPVPTTALLDFPYSDDRMLYDKAIYGERPVDSEAILNNDNRQNNLWTGISGATFGFIIPDSNTYLTLGHSGGHESGVGYKITQDTGYTCGGPCAYRADDIYNYYWLWRVSDLVKVKNGELNPWDVRPYDYGKLDTPSNARLFGGAYDAQTGKLYVSLKQGDQEMPYQRPPIFYVYQVAAAL